MLAASIHLLDRAYSMRRKTALIAASIMMIFATSLVHAQEWGVRDDDARDKLGKIESHTKDINTAIGDTGSGGGKTVNANLDAIRQKLMIGDFTDQRPGDRAKDPDPALPKKDSDGATLIKDASSQCGSLPKPQQDVCQQIVQIQNAQYKFMLAMYENSATRDQMLRDIIKDRKNIQSNDPNSLGKLEENTNQLTALYNLIALDQQQIQTVNYAYDANLKYLRDEQARLSRSANTGKSADKSGISLPIPGVGDVDLTGAINGLAAGAVLKLALQSAGSDKPAGYKTLSVTKGW